MKTFNQFVCEANKQTVVFTFGRMNPPTKGHEALMNFAQKQAALYGAEYRIYLSHSQDKKKNPLSYDEKLKIVRAGMPAHARAIRRSMCKNPFEIVEKELVGFDRIIFCIGEDRASEFARGMKRYPNVEIVYIPRPPGAVSATQVRQAAVNMDFKTFHSCMPSAFQADKNASMMLLNRLHDILTG